MRTSYFPGFANQTGATMDLLSARMEPYQQDLLRAILAAMPEPFFIYDENGRYVEILGGSDRDKYHDARHLVGKTLDEIFDPKTARRFLVKIRSAIRTGKVVSFVYPITPEAVADYQGRLGPQGEQWFEAHISPVRVEPGETPLAVWMAFNITGHKKALASEKRLEKKLIKLALADPLTGLLNRRGVFEKSRLLLEKVNTGEVAEVAVVIADIDRFKSINDNYGHPAGDLVLRALARELIHSLRSGDIIGRIGGEEFAILLPGCPLALAQSIAERLRERLAANLVLAGSQKIAFTVSLGLSLYKKGEMDFEAAVRRADAALYQAKQTGRNKVCTEE